MSADFLNSTGAQIVLAPYRYIPLASPILRILKRRISALLYAGNRVECVLCGRTFRCWRSGSQSGCCPYCGSNARHRLLWMYVSSQWNAERMLDVLHFAPEWCLKVAILRHPCVGRYVTADRSAPEADVHTDITAINLPDESFDTVLCVHVLEHVPDDRRAMREMRRILKPQGVAYVLVPMNQEALISDEDPRVTDPVERTRRWGQFDHVRRYGWDLTERLTDAGLTVSVVRASDIIPIEEHVRYGLWEDLIFHCVRTEAVSRRGGDR